jgi:hypothetical protein
VAANLPTHATPFKPSPGYTVGDLFQDAGLLRQPQRPAAGIAYLRSLSGAGGEPGHAGMGKMKM